METSIYGEDVNYMSHIEGTDEAKKMMDKVGEATKLKEAIGKACALIELAAKKKAPKGNGELRRSITSEVFDTVGIVYTPLEYAPYVEYGTGLFAEEGGRKDVPWNYQDDKGEWHRTSGMKPQPFMRPAYNENRAIIVKMIEEALKK